MSKRDVGLWVCSHCFGNGECEHCNDGVVRCERPDCGFDAIERKNGQRLCALCAKESKHVA